MSALFGDDTSPEVEAILIAGFRRMTPAERLARACDLSLAVRQLALARLRSEHPSASERELQLRLAALTIDAETMRRAFNWPPESTLSVPAQSAGARGAGASPYAGATQAEGLTISARADFDDSAGSPPEV